MATLCIHLPFAQTSRLPNGFNFISRSICFPQKKTQFWWFSNGSWTSLCHTPGEKWIRKYFPWCRRENKKSFKINGEHRWLRWREVSIKWTHDVAVYWDFFLRLMMLPVYFWRINLRDAPRSLNAFNDFLKWISAKIEFHVSKFSIEKKCSWSLKILTISNLNWNSRKCQ